MILLRRVLGDALRARRQSQHRTLREVSGAANVSLGYLSEIERGQKEASSELLAAICDALGAQLSEVLRDVSDTLEFAELTESDRVLSGRAPLAVGGDGEAAVGGPAGVDFAPPAPREPGVVTNFVGDGGVSVAVRRDGPLRTTLRTTRPAREVIGIG
jgi:transcriptional regulator with XRE-family HTH domain